MTLEDDLRALHRPFLAEVARRAAATAPPYIVALAGIPGSGKSTLAAAWAALARAEHGLDLRVLPMDGFHHRNAWLETHVIERGGRRQTLRAQKGCPESFDAAALLRALRDLRAGVLVRWPRYDRDLHEPAPAAEPLPAAGAFLVEGNYLLLDQPPWREAAALADLRVRIEVDIETALAAVAARHVRGGRSPEDARAHVDRCDRPNAELVIRRALPADACVARDADWRFGPVRWCS